MDFRLAGKVLQQVPFLGDLINAGLEAGFGRYAGTKKAIPAAVMTGLGGAAASAMTGGADVIPGITDVIMTTVSGAKGGKLSPGERALAKGAATTNPDRYISAVIRKLLEDKNYDEAQELLRATRSMTSVPPSF